MTRVKTTKKDASINSYSHVRKNTHNLGKDSHKVLIYPELSYQIMGICFKVQNKLGAKYEEKYYQRAIEIELRNQQIIYKREQMLRLSYEGESIGRYYVDFVIENRMVLETKTVDFFKKKDYSQVLAYLNSLNLKLAILVNFNTPKLSYKRIVNPKIRIN